MTAVAFPLSLKPAPAAVREPAAWFVPGDDAGRWLGEVARWGVPMGELRLYVVPTSIRDRTPTGVLVVTPGGTAAPQNVRRALPYGLIAGRLFLPADAVLSPPASDAELREKLLHDVQVLHPTAGLVGFRADEALRVHDLLAPPARRDVSWGHAVATEASAGRLVAVEAEEVPRAAADVIDLGRGDIGSEAPDALPPAPDESKLDEMREAFGRAGRPGISFIKWLTSLAPKRAGAPTWVNHLRDWADRKLAGMGSALESARRRELERLQKMLGADPDEGLRHAIPLRDLGGRGRAPPGARLGPRDVHFSLSGLRGGGRPSDPWAVPPDVVQSLTRRYREAAGRELRLGRYRRAAYIFAHLLGDFAAAANALEQGRHYREAAVFYREHLKNPRKAAECLEQGGLIQEAIPIYEELGLFETAGDLHARLGQPDEAVRCYRAQVAAQLARADFLATARLLETKLQSPDEALDVLAGAWPGADASGACLRASFQLLGRLARHDEAAARIGKLRAAAAAPPFGHYATLAQVLADVATTYPEQNVRAAGADATRVVAGHRLSTEKAGPGDREALARAVGRLAPEDRLLARDVERFLAHRPEPRRAATAPTPQRLRAANDPVVLRSFRLPQGLAWKAAAAGGEGFYALGIVRHGLCAVRGRWDGQTQVVYARINGPLPAQAEWGLQPVPNRSLVTVTPAVGTATPLTFPARDPFGGQVELGSPAWLPDDVLALDQNENGTTWLLRQLHDGRLTLDAHRSDGGALLASHAIDAPSPPPAWPDLVTRGDAVYVAWGGSVLHLWPRRGPVFEPAPRPVRRLAASTMYMRRQVAAALDEGAWLLADDNRYVICEGFAEPQIAFTRGGMLVAADARSGRVYVTESGAPRRRGEFISPGAGLIALTPTSRLHEFAAFTADGRVSVYQIPT